MSDAEKVPTPADTTPVILDALKRAADAHGIHEATELGGVRDEQWPEWYAKHMTQTLNEAGYLLMHMG